MAGFGPDLCLFIILLFRLAGIFGSVMTFRWAMGQDTKITRDHLANGFMVMLFCQYFSAITEFIALNAYFAMLRKYNVNAFLGPGFSLPFFAHEVSLLYLWLKARKYCDLADSLGIHQDVKNAIIDEEDFDFEVQSMPDDDTSKLLDKGVYVRDQSLAALRQ